MSRRRRSPARPQQTPGSDFWGHHRESPAERPAIRPTTDPGSLPRSLGDPPLGPRAEGTLGEVYKEAVRAATALAAANGLLADDNGPSES